MPIIRAICTSPTRGTPKSPIDQGEFIAGYGLKGDAHAGNWNRQVSMLAMERIDPFRSMGAKIEHGDFGENLVIEGMDFTYMTEGTILRSGEVVFEITQIGKECHKHCAIYKRIGDCIMPREGIFVKVIHGGTIQTGDEIHAE
jgi:MOSC domain-containing protein YiiM